MAINHKISGTRRVLLAFMNMKIQHYLSHSDHTRLLKEKATTYGKCNFIFERQVTSIHNNLLNPKLNMLILDIIVLL